MAAYELFTPNESGQRSVPTYYRGCWHVVGRTFFCRYRHFRFVPAESGLQPEGLVPHAASLRQAFAHCARFPTAASRRSLGRVSVPVWPFTLSGRLPVVALVGRYPTNKLIVGRGPIPDRRPFPTSSMRRGGSYPVLDPVSRAYPRVGGRLPTCYSHLFAARSHPVLPPSGPRSTCMAKHAASVHPEPGSNSPSEIVNSSEPEARRGVLEGSSAALEPPSLTIRPGRTGGWAYRDQPCTAQGSSVIRMRWANRWGRAPGDGVLALAFHTLLSFQGTSPGCSSATHLRFPRPVTAGAAGRYHGLFKIVKDFPPARSAYSWWSTARRRHLHTEAPPSPHLLGVRTATEQPSDRILLALGDLPSSDADAVGVVPERSSVSKNFLLAAWRR